MKHRLDVKTMDAAVELTSCETKEKEGDVSRRGRDEQSGGSEPFLNTSSLPFFFSSFKSAKQIPPKNSYMNHIC